MAGRKSKYDSLNNILHNHWKVAIYIRLSVEDGDDKEESYSISNQRKLISMFLNSEPDLALYDYYIDDGYTGTNFNRPSFMRMLEDIKTNKVNVVLVKDLSRLGRNYIEVGNYLEHIFPSYNVRFIAINDNIDSYKEPNSVNNIIVPFKNLMNDEYCRDISNKVKSVFEAKKRNGEYMGGIAPYGYIRDPKDKHHLIVDDEAANVVKEIFKLALDGKGRMLITKTLNERGIYSPFEYKRKVLKINCGNRWDTDDLKPWNGGMVATILKNQMYCGDMVQGKERRISYKIHKQIKVPKDEWIIVPNTHEAIIDRDTFNKVQDIIFSRDTKVTNKGELSMFAGHLKCADCKRSMTRSVSRSKSYEARTGNKRYRYYCSTYSKQSSKLCTKHAIGDAKLQELILESLKVQIDLVIDIEKTIKEISDIKNSNYDRDIIEKNIKKVECEIEKNKNLKKSIYEDWKLGVISKEDYMDYSKDYDESIQKQIVNLNFLKEKLSLIKQNEDSDKKWIQEFTKRRNITKLTKDVIDDLINIIYIHENEHITIVYKYQDEFNEALEYIKEKQKIS